MIKINLSTKSGIGDSVATLSIAGLGASYTQLVALGRHLDFDPRNVLDVRARQRYFHIFGMDTYSRLTLRVPALLIRLAFQLAKESGLFIAVVS